MKDNYAEVHRLVFDETLLERGRTGSTVDQVFKQIQLVCLGLLAFRRLRPALCVSVSSHYP